MSLDSYQEFIHRSRYSRWLPEEKRRETYSETVNRYVDYVFADPKLDSVREEVRDAIMNMDVLPSMRAFMTAGPAAARCNMSLYNCSFIAIDSPRAFDEVLYVLLAGTGVGFSCESAHVAKLPVIAESFHDTDSVIVVGDSKIGWASSFRELVSLLYVGKVPKWDVSKVRPAGAPLKTFGGTASGPEPLVALFEYAVRLFKGAAGRQFTSLEVHDLVCQIASIVVVGGVRRCIPEGSMVHTRQGLIPIEFVEIGAEVLTSKGYSKVLDNRYQGVQRLVSIKTQDGTFECTGNHRVAVLTSINSYDWVMASDVKPGMRMVGSSVAIEGTVTSLPTFNYSRPKHSTTCKDISIPTLDIDVAWLIGLFHGDGYVRLTEKSGELSIPVHNNTPLITERAMRILERFGVNVRFLQLENYGVIRVKSKQLASYFHNYIKQPNTTIDIPDFIVSGTLDVRLAYLGGVMDADGSVKNRPKTVCCSVYPKFILQLQQLASSCGIQTRSKELSRGGLKDEWQTKYGLSVINNPAKVLIQKHSVKKFEVGTIEQCTNTYPSEMLAFSYANNYPWSKSDVEGKLLPVEVVSVDEIDVFANTFDLKVEGTEEFFCNGYLVHNSALISLSDLGDVDLAKAKSGQWWHKDGQRALSNNSAIYNGRPSVATFMNEWQNLYESRSGERGIINRSAANKNSPRREPSVTFGTNPCGEIVLRSNQLCNLSEVILRPTDTQTDIERKVRIATIIGTVQSSFTDFKYVRSVWKRNCDEERLLGVSFTGICDNEFMSTPSVELEGFLDSIREQAIQVNKELAEVLNINASVAITCVKPAGTTSELTGTSSGIHPGYSKYYIRNVRNSVSDPVSFVLGESGIPFETDVMNAKSFVFSFPRKSNAVYTRHDVSAIEQLELYLCYRKHWTEHNVSSTIYVGENEWVAVAAWVWEHFDDMFGVSFLPKEESDHVYQQAPFTECTEQQYNELAARMPSGIDWSLLRETRDETVGAQMLACSAGGCNI
jgi:intein/homing endonuclease